MTITQDAPEIAEVEETNPPTRRRGLVRRVAMRGRRVFVRAHRWLAFALLAWLVVICVTGGWLVFNQGLDGLLHSERHRHTSGDVGPARALAAAEEALPEGAYAYFVTLPANARGVYRVWFGQPAASGIGEDEDYGSVFVDPGTGRVNARTYDNEGFTHWMYRGHMYLWQDRGLFSVFTPERGWCARNADGAEPGGAKGVVCDVIPDGEDMVGYFGLAWIVVLLTGFYLWYWPGVRRWATAFVIKRGRGAFATNMSVHKVVGLVVFVPLLVVTFTGVAFAYPNMKGWFENATPANRGRELWVMPETVVSGAANGRAPLGADAIRDAIEREFPERKLAGVEPPGDEETGTWKAWVDRGFSPWTREGGAGNTYVALDQYTGQVLYDGSPEDGNVFDQAWSDWSFPLHTGDFAGTPSRTMWVVLATSPLVLGGTGLTMWLIRRKKRRRRATSAAPATPA